MGRFIIFALFIGSGMAGLVYQVVWTKLLALVFGVTLLAVSTVLTCFFGGLALGSWLGGKFADRTNGGFKWYGIAEIIIGVYALSFPLLLKINNSVYVLFASKTDAGFYGLSLFKFVLSALILIIPTTLMGATLPILSRAVASTERRFAKDIGGLYTVNTAGAVAGSVLSAFVFMPAMGMTAILYSVGAFSIALGIVAFLLGRLNREEGAIKAPENRPAKETYADTLPDAFSKLLLLGFAVSGFTGLIYEVIWTRVLGFVLTGTIYAFAAVLAVFLTGIALGSLIFSLFIDRFKSAGPVITILAAVEAAIGIISIALITLYDRLPSFGFYRTIDSTPVWSEFV